MDTPVLDALVDFIVDLAPQALPPAVTTLPAERIDRLATDLRRFTMPADVAPLVALAAR